MSFPICKRHKLLFAVNKENDPYVASARLHGLLGEKTYQRCCKTFKYSTQSGPRPDEIECFLRTDPAARKILEKVTR